MSPYNSKGVSRSAALLLAGTLIFRLLVSGAAYPFMDSLVTIMVLIALGLVCIENRGVRGAPRSGASLVYLTAALWLWCLASVLWSTDAGMGVRELVILTAGLGTFHLSAYLVRHGGNAYPAVRVLFLVVALLVSLRAIYQKLWGLNALREALESMAVSGQEAGNLAAHIASGRVFAGFLNPNMLAGFCALMIPVGLALVGGESDLPRRMTSGAAVALLFVTVILTGSLGGSLAVAFGVFLYFLLSGGIRWRHAAATLIIAGVLLLPLFSVRGADFLLGPDGSLTQRVGYMAAGLRMGLVHPLKGWGTGSVPGALMAYVSSEIRPVNDPHNFLVRAWVTWGAVGLGLLLGFLLSWGREIGREWGDPKGRRLRAGFIGSSAAFLAHSLIDMNFWMPEVVLFGWAVMGGAAGWALRQDGSGDEAVPHDPKRKRMAAGFFFSLCLPLFIVFQAEFFAFQGRQAALRQDFINAGGYFGRARSLLPFAGRLTLEEGRSLGQAGRFDRARSLLNRAQEQLPASPYPPWELARLDLAEGKPGAALRHLDRALERFPTSPRVRLDRVEALLRMGRTDEAVDELRKVVILARFDPPLRKVAEDALGGITAEGASGN
jgi:O-antigen ligase